MVESNKGFFDRIWDMLENNKLYQNIAICLTLYSVLFTGMTYIFMYQRDLFIQLDIIKLVLLSVGIASPSFIIHFFIAEHYIDDIIPEVKTGEVNRWYAVLFFASWYNIIAFYAGLLTKGFTQLRMIYILGIITFLAYTCTYAMAKSEKGKKKKNKDTLNANTETEL